MHFARSPNTAAWLKELQNVNSEVKQSGCTWSKSTHDICSLEDMKRAPGVRTALPYWMCTPWERSETKLRQNYSCNRGAEGLAYSEVNILYKLYKLFSCFYFQLFNKPTSYKSFHLFKQLCKTHGIIMYDSTGNQSFLSCNWSGAMPIPKWWLPYSYSCTA